MRLSQKVVSLLATLGDTEAQEVLAQWAGENNPTVKVECHYLAEDNFLSLSVDNRPTRRRENDGAGEKRAMVVGANNNAPRRHTPTLTGIPVVKRVVLPPTPKVPLISRPGYYSSALNDPLVLEDEI